MLVMVFVRSATSAHRTCRCTLTTIGRTLPSYRRAFSGSVRQKTASQTSVLSRDRKRLTSTGELLFPSFCRQIISLFSIRAYLSLFNCLPCHSRRNNCNFTFKNKADMGKTAYDKRIIVSTIQCLFPAVVRETQIVSHQRRAVDSRWLQKVHQTRSLPLR